MNKNVVFHGEFPSKLGLYFRITCNEGNPLNIDPFIEIYRLPETDGKIKICMSDLVHLVEAIREAQREDK